MAYKVIDVSEWQGSINWAKAKADGVVGAIIRYADGSYNDKYFTRNMKECKRHGIHVGSYIFSRATTVSGAVTEARRIIAATRPYSCDMPIYIDMEWSGQAKVANTIADAFLSECNKQGVRGGIYANLNWFNNYVSPTRFAKYPLWIAQYYKVLQAKNPSLFGMWQYSSTGKVAGVPGNCDMNHCYIAYWNNGAKPTPTPAPTPAKQKLTVDGIWGADTVRATQKYFNKTQDGIISSQANSQRKYLMAIVPSAWEFVSYPRGSVTIIALQKLIGASADGLMGANTIKALQTFLNKKNYKAGTVDGYMGKQTVKAWQTYLNEH